MSMTADNVKEFYAHDLVYKFDKHKRITFGMVSHSYEGSADSYEFSSLQKGQILVSWNNSPRNQICRQSKVHLMSRSIIPGDIVRRLEEGRETQRGYCKRTRQVATVQIVGSDKVVEHVSENRLCFVKTFDVGDPVALGKMYGRIQVIDQRIRMQSRCGSIVEITTDGNYSIRDSWNLSTNGTYLGPGYPGQTVVCTPLDLKEPKWLKKTKAMKLKMNIDQTFTIQSIEVCRVKVWWFASRGESEYSEIKDEELKRLKVLPYTEQLVLCDRHLLKLQPSDVLLKKSDWIKKISLQYLPGKVPSKTAAKPTLNATAAEDEWYTDEDEEETNGTGDLSRELPKLKSKNRHCPPKPNKFKAGSIVPVEVLCIESKATVVWQDGTEEEDIPTTELYYSISLDDHEFFPGEWIVPNTNDNATDTLERFGVVQKVNFMERTAEIKWFSATDDAAAPLKLLETRESSVYDLNKHAQYVFRPGSVVKARPVQDTKVLGKVIDSCPQGYVVVQWLGGVVEHCWPQQIELIPESNELDLSDLSDSDDDIEDSSSWETESVESFDGDVFDEVNLENMAAKVDFIRNRISYLLEVFRQHNLNKNFNFLKDLLCVYDNSSYLDKYLDTSFFSSDSKHFQALLLETRKKAQSLGIELRGRLFHSDNLNPANRLKIAERDNIKKMIRLESEVNAQIESNKESCSAAAEKSCLDNLCVELLLMLKVRLDLVYAEIISRIGGPQALTVLTNAENALKPSSSNATLQKALLSPEVQLPRVEKAQTDAFIVHEEAPDTHSYYTSKFEPKDQQRFLNTLLKEYKLLKDSLPSGVWVRAFDNRTDLLSVMIRGPAKTPYEDGLFMFDIQLSRSYPKNPPSVHYISYIGEALNPNLYVKGKVCVSLLGTWMGRGSEVWTANSTLLQLIVSIQGLILVAEPYYNEAGYERQTHTQQGYENSRTYNEYVVLKLVQSMTELLNGTPKVFEKEVLEHFESQGEAMCTRLMSYCEENAAPPDFALLPVSKGFKLSLVSVLDAFKEALAKALKRKEGRC